MRERIDRGLEPIADVLTRVITQVSIVWQAPWLADKKRDRIHARRYWNWLLGGKIGPRPARNNERIGEYIPENFDD